MQPSRALVCIGHPPRDASSYSYVDDARLGRLNYAQSKEFNSVFEILSDDIAVDQYILRLDTLRGFGNSCTSSTIVIVQVAGTGAPCGPPSPNPVALVKKQADTIRGPFV